MGLELALKNIPYFFLFFFAQVFQVLGGRWGQVVILRHLEKFSTKKSSKKWDWG